MNTSDYYQVGKITRPHGLKGEVTALFTSDIPIEINSREVLFIKVNSQMVPHFIKSISQNGDKAYIRFDDIDSLDDAKSMAGQELFLPKSMRPKSGKDEFYDDEIIGFNVEDDSLGMLGKVDEIMQSGLQRLILLLYEDKEVLIPTNLIKSIDKRKRKITVNLPEGYLDI